MYGLLYDFWCLQLDSAVLKNKFFNNMHLNSSKIDELSWLARLRWLAIIGQLVLVFLAHDILIPQNVFWPIISIIVGVAVSNLILQFSKLKFFRRFEYILVFDISALTALLYYSGGASNPFSFFYVVHVALAAILLGQTWVWGLTLLSSVCYGILFFFKIDLPELSTHHDMSMHLDYGINHAFSLHLQGMWVAFSLVAITLAFFFTRIIAVLKNKENQIRRVENEALRIQRLADITGLAANAAHQLNTPLATIKIAAEEMQTKLNKEIGANSNLSQDAELILNQVRRCSQILSNLRIEAGDLEGEKSREVAFEDIYLELLNKFDATQISSIELDADSKEITLAVPQRPFIEALSALVKNALESGPAARVKLIASRQTSYGQKIIVKDNGAGIPQKILEKVGQAFFSTKADGQGLGLGIFLAKSFAEKLGGSLQISTKEGSGTEVTIQIPVI